MKNARIIYYLSLSIFLKILKKTQNKSWVKGFAKRGGKK
jgi:hypothetical protein